MNGKTMSAILISTILGAVIGFGASYLVLFSPIQNLQDELSRAQSDMNSEIDDIKTDITTLQTDLSSARTSMTSIQSSLSSVQSDVDSLTSTVDTIDSREWHEVYTIGGSSDTITGTFQLKGKMLKISWLLYGLSADAWVEIDLRFANGTGYWVNGSSGVWGAFDAEGPIEQTGLYYLTIYSYNADAWAVAIYDYY